MEKPAEINWDALSAFARELNEPDARPDQRHGEEYLAIQRASEKLIAAKDWDGILRLRDLFDFLLGEDSVTIQPEFLSLNDAAIEAAKIQQKPKELARFLATKGQNLHRMGQHNEAIDTFREAYDLYLANGEKFKALENLHMTALCLRPLGKTEEARAVLEEVISSFTEQDPFLGHPYRTLAWLERDENHLEEAEALIRKSLDYHIRGNAPENIIAETLSDLGEVVGLRDRYEEAKRLFEESLSRFDRIGSKVVRQVARAQSKYAELELRMEHFDHALVLLDKADGILRGSTPYHDQLWKIDMLSVNIHLRKGEVLIAYRKFWSAMSSFRKTKMKPRDFIRQVVNRTRIGSGVRNLSRNK